MKERRDVLKSRQAIMDAYLALCLEKSTNKISVKDIIEKANISKGTFYAHYLDIPDLEEKIIDYYMQTKFADLKNLENIYENMDEYIYNGLCKMRENQKLLLAISNGGKNHAIYESMKKAMLKRLDEAESLSQDNDAIIDQCVVNTYIGLSKLVVEDTEQLLDLKKVSLQIADFIQNGINA